MKRRNFIVGLSATAAGGVAVVGSGAFDSVEADRTVSVETTDDADAYLGIEEIEDSDTSDEFTEFSEYDGNETLKIDFNTIPGPEGGLGVGHGSEYIFTEVFRVENQGTADNVDVDFELDEDPQSENRPDEDPVEEFELIDEDEESLNDVNLDLDPGEFEDIGVRLVTLREEDSSEVDGDITGTVRLIAE